VHDARELAIALDVGARIVGVKNPNIRTLEVDVRASDDLITRLPADVVAVSESGLKTAADVVRLRALGYRAFLIGERFMTAPDPGAELRAFIAGVAVTATDGEGAKGAKTRGTAAADARGLKVLH
jgi:indole-3-glycerol phosphate synthase